MGVLSCVWRAWSIAITVGAQGCTWVLTGVGRAGLYASIKRARASLMESICLFIDVSADSRARLSQECPGACGRHACSFPECAPLLSSC